MLSKQADEQCKVRNAYEMIPLGGTVESGFERVRDLLADNIGSGKEIGASLYVDIDGEPVVDLWGGWSDSARTRPWDDHTIVNLYSATKCVTSLAVLMLVDRGAIDVYAPVAKYWPEFGQNGKEGVEVRHLLGHTSGVPGWEQPFRTADVFDLKQSTDKLARQAPWYEPGTAGCYHAINFGHLNGELVRRVTGKSLGTFIADEIAGPLDADFILGLDDAEFGRIAPIVLPDGIGMPGSDPASRPTDPAVLNSPAYKTAISIPGSTGEPGVPSLAALANTHAWRRAEIGAANGHGNARGMGRMLSAITNGGVSRGVRLLSAETIDLIFKEQFNGTDLFIQYPIRWGIGYALSSSDYSEANPPFCPFVQPSGKMCWWHGWGGSFATMDVERKVTITYAMNQLHLGASSQDDTVPPQGLYDVPASYSSAVYACLNGGR